MFRSARGSLFRLLLLRWLAGRALGRGRALPGGPVNVLAANQRIGGFAIAGFVAAVVGLFINPLVAWIWVGGAIVVLGAVFAIWPGRRRPRTAEA